MAKSLQEEAQKTKNFYYYEKELQMHENNREIDQEKQNNSVAR